ncbi:TATA-box-binding protein [Haloquadratum walsbyi]|uniref:TATA-box-binding protein n=1 Tax=Haloquadratum walsbyi (strain DSM 16854 / JCM 12705 / C23) TaxID=768065 RepID=G0LHV4_HALWC|nr:TATA-box-binding protein [Haloquadratum walsbyi]CCC39342.1 TATA-binding transcription initiation factor [Haloquadratum walsbyi C23]
MVKVVNIVTSGSLGTELDLENVYRDVGAIGEYDPNKYPAVYFRFKEDAPLVTLYRTGKYIVTGADSKEEAYSIRDRFLGLLAEQGMIAEQDDEWFRIQNLVCTAELGESLNLNALAIGLGLEMTEYEPEQFPGLTYRPTGTDSVVLLFASGRVVITGSPDLDTAEETFAALQEEVTDLLAID